MGDDMGMIGINKLIFPATVMKMATAGGAINGTISSWTSQGERAIAFSKFVVDYNLLQCILKEYKELVQKDMRTITKIGTELIKVDSSLLAFWR